MLRRSHTWVRLSLLLVLAATWAVMPRPSSAVTEWQPVPNMDGSRIEHSAVRLLDGRVLVVGGHLLQPDKSAQVYDPVTNSWSLTSGLTISRSQGTATLLEDGTVLFAGGLSVGDFASNLVDLFDPETNNWTQIAPMAVGRTLHSATLLEDGSVLIAGGRDDSSGVLNHAERYDPTSGNWVTAGLLAVGHSYFTLTRLNDGTALAVGGLDGGNGEILSVERYDLSTDVWSPASNLLAGHRLHDAVLLDDGRVLVAGGQSNVAQIYDPASNLWEFTASMLAQNVAPALTLLSDGTVMLSGGLESNVVSGRVSIFNPVAEVWFQTGALTVGRYYHTATLLNDGSVLVTGGQTAAGATDTAQRYPPNQNPVANAPIQSLRVSTLDPTAVPITVGWWVAADTDPILSYFLQQKVGTGSAAYTTIPLEQPQQISKVRKLIPGSTYRYRLIAKDFRGANSEFANGVPKKLLAIQDSDTAAITYAGTWATVTNANMFGTTGKYSSTAGNSAIVSFTGTNIGWVTRKSNTGGKAEVWLDGVKMTTVDLYTTTLRQRQMVFVRNGLAPGAHTLEIRVLGTKSSGSVGTRIDIDVFIVLQ